MSNFGRNAESHLKIIKDTKSVEFGAVNNRRLLNGGIREINMKDEGDM